MTYSHNETAKITGIPASGLRRMHAAGPIRGEGIGRTWTRSQVLGLAAMRHARIAGASMPAAVGMYEILKLADWSKLVESWESGRRYLRVFGDKVDRRPVDRTAAFDSSLIAEATAGCVSYVVVDVGRWLELIEAFDCDAVDRPEFAKK
jgi:hypothetical protein